MIHITWHCALLIVVIIIGFMWVCSSDDSNGGYLGISSQFVGCSVWFILTLILILVYGGIFWW